MFRPHRAAADQTDDLSVSHSRKLPGLLGAPGSRSGEIRPVSSGLERAMSIFCMVSMAAIARWPRRRPGPP